MRMLRYLTHPQVRIDSNVPVPLWGLSDFGRDRVERFKHSSALRNTKLIVSSAETKALETAAIIAGHICIPVLVRNDAHENDRSATGFLPPPEFEAVANEFFENPDESIRGWERAIDAQRRIVKVVEDVLQEAASDDLLFVGHGGVGTLLLCYLSSLPIQRIRDQPQGGGNIFAFDMDKKEMIHSWQAMEDLSR
jgi:broad specificity phosphatase PhoE